MPLNKGPFGNGVTENIRVPLQSLVLGPPKNPGPVRYLQVLYKEPQVTQVIRSNRLRWLGYIWRSPENNQTRAYIFKNPMGSRTRGRPPTRWIDDVENDLNSKY
ncbi:endonuclease-reverse transcriptase [Trichonephila clavipes]|nr:endonuclease-reverse transcriptase [Trichonephila clavipes]